jgi:hypothetical protein
MHAETRIKQEAPADSKLRIFSLYVDFAASAHAKWVTGTITKLAGPTWKNRTEMWHLDSCMAGEQLRKIMLQEAADADMLIVALCSLDYYESRLMEWLTALAGHKAEHQASRLFIGLLGDEDHQAGELRATVKHFIHCAKEMGRDFIWQWMGREAIQDDTWLTDKVGRYLSRKRFQLMRETLADVGGPTRGGLTGQSPTETGPAAL